MNKWHHPRNNGSKFFIKPKRPHSSSSRASTIIRQSPNRKYNRPRESNNPRSQTTPIETNRQARLQHSIAKPHLVRVKGRSRLIKYLSKADMKKSCISSNSSHQYSGQDRRIPNKPSHVRTSYKATTSLLYSDKDILLYPSGLRMPTKLQKKSKRLPQKVNPGKKPMTYRNKNTSRKGKKAMGEVAGPTRGSLEAYGFKVRFPKGTNLVQISTLNAEAELSDFSGIYVLTVP